MGNVSSMSGDMCGLNFGSSAPFERRAIDALPALVHENTQVGCVDAVRNHIDISALELHLSVRSRCRFFLAVGQSIH